MLSVNSYSNNLNSYSANVRFASNDFPKSMEPLSNKEKWVMGWMSVPRVPVKDQFLEMQRSAHTRRLGDFLSKEELPSVVSGLIDKGFISRGDVNYEDIQSPGIPVQPGKARAIESASSSTEGNKLVINPSYKDDAKQTLQVLIKQNS